MPTKFNTWKCSYLMIGVSLLVLLVLGIVSREAVYCRVSREAITSSGSFMFWNWPWEPHPDPKNGEIVWAKKCDESLNSTIYECGTLFAPLDYTNPNDTRQAEIALIRYKAGEGRTPRSDVLGSIILNPGGPGGSGVRYLGRETTAHRIDAIVEAKYDLVSFDPRGVGKTTPNPKCFQDGEKDLYYNSIADSYGLPGQHGRKVMKHEIGYLLAELDLLSDVCANSSEAEYFQYISSPFVCRDMNLLHKNLGDEKLNYWGTSYGTTLGYTYASMFPEDVNRIILDSVDNVDQYYAGLWNADMVDAEKVLDGFFEECEASGPHRCKLAELIPKGNGGSVRSVVLEWFDSLKTEPAIVLNTSPPRLLTYEAVISDVYSDLYAPAYWPSLAERLHDAIRYGNASAFFNDINFHPAAKSDSFALLGIACSDALSDVATAESKWGITEFEKFWKPMYEDSPHFSIYDAYVGVACSSSWKFRGSERLQHPKWGNTSFPILLIGIDLDPATPARNADLVSKKFDNSVVVRRAGYGHGSGSQPSKCLDEIIYNYLVEGELPLPGTHCDVDSRPFDDPVNNSMVESFVPERLQTLHLHKLYNL